MASVRVFRRFEVVLASAAFALAVSVLLIAPHEVWAAAGSGGDGGGGTLQSATNFKNNGLSSLKAVGAVVFACVAIYGIARGTLGGKIGQGLTAFAVACLGMAVALDPQSTMSTIGQWATDLFKS